MSASSWYLRADATIRISFLTRNWVTGDRAVGVTLDGACLGAELSLAGQFAVSFRKQTTIPATSTFHCSRQSLHFTNLHHCLRTCCTALNLAVTTIGLWTTNDPRPFVCVTVILREMRTVQDGGLGAQALHVVHRKGGWDRAKTRVYSVHTSGVPQHPAYNDGIFFIVFIITDWKSTNKDVSFVGSRSSHQFHFWKTTIGFRHCIIPKISTVVVPTNMVVNTLAVVVAVAFFVLASIAARAEVPVSICSTSSFLSLCTW